MPIFTTKLSHVRFSLSPFSSESMMGIGEVMVEAKRDRIAQAVNSQDQPAKPLTVKYATEKQKGRYVSMGGRVRYSGPPIRNWRMRGWTMASAKVKSANENQVTIGFINPQADFIITAQRRLDEMWSDSPSDTRAMHAIVRETLRTQQIVRVIRTAAPAKSA